MAGLEWDAVEDDVRRMRQRIFEASQAGDLKRVRGLQKLMLRSRSNTLHSVRRVTRLSAGGKAPAVDGQVALTSLDRAEVRVAVHRHLTTRQALDQALTQIPDRWRSKRVLIRADGAGYSHALIGLAPKHAWQAANNSDGGFREQADVIEITGLLDLTSWTKT